MEGRVMADTGRQGNTEQRAARPEDRQDDGPGGSERSARDVAGGRAKMSGGSRLAAAKRTLLEFAEDQLTDRAAALTYYAVLSIFPGLLVVVSLLGLLGKSATQPLITN